MPVTVPHIVCSRCGRSTSMWSPRYRCEPRQSIDDESELPPAIGERFRDVLDERRLELEECHV